MGKKQSKAVKASQVCNNLLGKPIGQRPNQAFQLELHKVQMSRKKPTPACAGGNATEHNVTRNKATETVYRFCPDNYTVKEDTILFAAIGSDLGAISSLVTYYIQRLIVVYENAPESSDLFQETQWLRHCCMSLHHLLSIQRKLCCRANQNLISITPHWSDGNLSKLTPVDLWAMLGDELYALVPHLTEIIQLNLNKHFYENLCNAQRLIKSCLVILDHFECNV